MLISDNKFEGGWFDSHCHLNDLIDFRANVEQAEQNGIVRYLVPGTQPSQWASVIELKSKRVKFALGTHPWFVKDIATEIAALEQALQANPPNAVGEIGLDFYNGSTLRPTQNLQLESFEAQLNIAQRNDLPVIIHCVKAHQELIALLKLKKGSDGVVHAFSGSYELAKQYLDLGFKLGIGPQLLKSAKLRSTIQKCPIDRLLLETDAPYMAVTKGESNSLLDLISVGELVASLKEISVSEVQRMTAMSTEKLFCR